MAEIARLAVENLRHALSPHVRARAARARAFDQRWGTDTSGGIGVHALGFDAERAEHCRRYDPSSEAMLRDPVEMLNLDPATYDFFDYGAGKGRMLMLALEMGFRNVTGIELSQHLCAIARINLERFSAQQPEAATARITAGDAAAFVPSGKAILAYFYNPFDATIMQAVRVRLETALAGATDQVVVIYANPEHGQVFADAPGWSTAPNPVGVSTFVAHAADFRARAAA